MLALFIFAVAILLVPVAFAQTNSTNSTTSSNIDTLVQNSMIRSCLNITAMGGSDPSCNGVIANNMTQQDAAAALNLFKALHPCKVLC